jgi:lipid-binding SYLF domain-containing protein
MKIRSLTAVAAPALLGIFASGATFANIKAKIGRSADQALRRFYFLNPANRALVGKAAGVLIHRHVTKGGAAGGYGEGVMQVQGYTVDYYSIAAASVGLTLGVASHLEIILFMTQGSLDKFTQSEGWSAGGDTAITVVSQGAGAKYDSATLAKPILGFIFSENGSIGDVSLEGTKITKIKTTD